MGLQLIRRETCGLCELAAEILVAVGADEVQTRYLEDDPGLEVVYGWRIPVLRLDKTGRELDWPFDAVKIVFPRPRLAM